MQFTWNNDELFFQALAVNSRYKDSLAKHYGRYIVWDGSANPKALVMDDYDRLSSSPALFARKFDEAVNRDIQVFLARDCGDEMPML